MCSLSLLAGQGRARVQADLNLIDAMDQMGRFQVDGGPLPLGPDGEPLLPQHVRAGTGNRGGWRLRAWCVGVAHS